MAGVKIGRAGVVWAQQYSQTCWVLAVVDLCPRETLAWIAGMEVLAYQQTRNGNIAWLVRPTRVQLAEVMRQPQPQGIGSRHEAAYLLW